MTLFAFPVPQSATEIATIFCRKPNTIWFDSAREGHPQSKYSYILFNPVSLTRLVPSIPSPLRGEGQGGGEKERGGDKLPPFQGGWAGYWAYDGSEHLHYYEELFSFDHAQKKGWYLCRAASQDDAEKKFEKIKETVIARSGKAPWRSRRKYKILNVLDCFVRRCLPGNDKEVKWQSDFTQQEYQHAVQNIINHILEGDIFQANLTRKIWADAPEDFDPFDQYLKLRQTNPAPFAAYMNLGSFHILSASPESFLSLSANEDVITRPIKGTAKSAEDLKKSEKDYAENIMIVDLLRNDLSKVCEDNSVTVTDLCRIEQFEGLFHLVSDVQGKLRTGKTAKDLLMACFPGGSITGAPKEKAMEIIREQERSARGVYCGSLGWIGADGAMETNIAIRTVFYKDKEIWFHVGGGITTLSNPQKEYEETELKARAIKGSFLL